MRTIVRLSIALIGTALLMASPVPPAEPLRWVPAPGTQGRNVVAGTEGGQAIHVCRGAYQGGVHPGKTVAGKCNIGWGGKEIVLPTYEVLVGNGSWSRRDSSGAFAAGQENGAPLTLCRARFRETTHSGKVIAGRCNIGWGGEEKSIAEFEVFVPALRSQRSDQPVQLVMKNGSGAPVDVFWIDSNGEPQSYGSLGAGELRVQPTFGSHPWILKRGATIVATHVSTAEARQFLGLGVAPKASNVEAGPIWNQSEAGTKCPAVCDARAANWTKAWRTTVEGQMSVCECRGFM